MNDDEIIKTVDKWYQQNKKKKLEIIKKFTNNWEYCVAALLPGLIIFSLAIQLFDKVWVDSNGFETWGVIFYHLITLSGIAIMLFLYFIVFEDPFYDKNKIDKIKKVVSISCISTIFFWAIISMVFTIL